MSKTSVIKWGIGAFMVGLFGFTLNYLMIQIKKIVNIQWGFLGMQTKNISLKGFDIVLWWRVLNETDFSFQVANQTYDVYLNDIFVKKVGFAPVENIPTNSDSRIPTIINITTKELLNTGLKFSDLLLDDEGRKKLYLSVKGNMDVKIDFMPIRKVPFAFKDSIYNIMHY
jgi:LEA14-like dessication related protein